jgi:hypothetical protein
MHGRLVGAGKDAPQPFARLGHRGAGFIDDADPEHEAVIDTVITSQCGGYAGGLQPLGLKFALVAQRVVFASDYEGGGQAGQVRGAEW